MKLGRIAPPDFDHVAKYPLTALAPAARPVHVPVAIGVNWYTAFDSPVQGTDRVWRIKDSDLGSVRGGHCVCLEPLKDISQPGNEQDLATRWWQFYDQGAEGACEGFGHSRMLSILRRKTFDGFWLYHQAQAIDNIPGQHEGTTNRAALEILRTKGHVVATGHDAAHVKDSSPDVKVGIAAYRWATSVDDILAALGVPGRDHVVLLNSWGQQYPHRVLLPATILDRLLREGGEAGVVTER